MMNTRILKKLDAQDFKRRVLDQYQDKPAMETGNEQVRQLILWSYAPNIVSLLSASFFVYYLVKGYPTLAAVLLGIILVGVLAGNEFAKRKMILGQSKKYWKHRSVNAGIIFFLLLCVGVSMYSSYQGGSRIVLENSVPPTLPQDPGISAKQDELQKVNASIAAQESTKWKGVITVDANRNLKQLYPIQKALTAQILNLEAAQRAKQQASDNKHQMNTTNFAYVLGAISILADAVLIFMLCYAERIKYNVFRIETAGRNRTAGFHMNSTASTPSFSENMVGGSRVEVQGFLPEIENNVKNVFNVPVSDLELKALISGHSTLAGAYSRRDTDESQAKADYHKRRHKELKQAKASA